MKTNIVVNDSGFIWHFPVLFVAEKRAQYYVDRDEDTTFESEVEFVVNDPSEAYEWFMNNMNWEDVEAVATLVSTPKALKRPRMNGRNTSVDLE